jgi:hypothetical protein
MEPCVKLVHFHAFYTSSPEMEESAGKCECTRKHS